MKEYLLSQVSQDTWKALSLPFWKAEFNDSEPGSAFDGLDVTSIESTKLGIHIYGTTSYLPKGDKLYRTEIILKRPRFSSINDFTAKKLKQSELTHFELLEDNSILAEIS